jgi:hypothetical protein
MDMVENPGDGGEKKRPAGAAGLSQVVGTVQKVPVTIDRMPPREEIPATKARHAKRPRERRRNRPGAGGSATWSLQSQFGLRSSTRFRGGAGQRAFSKGAAAAGLDALA